MTTKKNAGRAEIQLYLNRTCHEVNGFAEIFQRFEVSRQQIYANVKLHL